MLAQYDTNIFYHNTAVYTYIAGYLDSNSNSYYYNKTLSLLNQLQLRPLTRPMFINLTNILYTRIHTYDKPVIITNTYHHKILSQSTHNCRHPVCISYRLQD